MINTNQSGKLSQSVDQQTPTYQMLNYGHSAILFYFVGNILLDRYFMFSKFHIHKHVDQFIPLLSLQWRHNGRDGVSNHQPHDCLLNRLFRRRTRKTSKLPGTGLFPENSPGTGEFPAQMASNAKNVAISWRHHVLPVICLIVQSTL